MSNPATKLHDALSQLGKPGPLYLRENATFSSLLRSRIISVSVDDSQVVFYLHAALLVAESERFSKDLKGSFKEADAQHLDLHDEEASLFGYFVEFMYRECSILTQTYLQPYDYPTLARLYALGDRLMALRFQQWVLWKFSTLSSTSDLPEDLILDMLETACQEIPEKPGSDDFMRDQIFYYAATHIERLREHGRFRRMLHDLAELGGQICLRIGAKEPRKPDRPLDFERGRFEPESVHAVYGQSSTALAIDVASPPAEHSDTRDSR